MTWQECVFVGVLWVGFMCLMWAPMKAIHNLAWDIPALLERIAVALEDDATEDEDSE